MKWFKIEMDTSFRLSCLFLHSSFASMSLLYSHFKGPFQPRAPCDSKGVKGKMTCCRSSPVASLGRSEKRAVRGVGGRGGAAAIILLSGVRAFAVRSVSGEILAEEMSASEAMRQML